MCKKGKTERVKISIPLSGIIGNVQRVPLLSPFPSEKKPLELFVVKQFAAMSQVACLNLREIRSAADDSRGMPDVLAEQQGKTIGIQVTELKVEHRPRSAHVASEIAIRLAGEVQHRFSPVMPVVVNVLSQTPLNEILRLNGREISQLAEIIATGCQDNRFKKIDPKAMSPSRYLALDVPPKLKGKIQHLTITPIPDRSWTGATGTGNVFVNFSFKSVAVSPSILKSLVNNAKIKKGQTKAEILLVWSRDEDFWSLGEQIADLMKKEFNDCLCERVYFLIFDCVVGSKQLLIIKSPSAVTQADQGR